MAENFNIRNAVAQAAKDTRKLTVLLVVGLSGAGKTTVMNVLEDLRFFAIDGLPAALLPQMLPLLNAQALMGFKGLAIGVEIDAPHSSDFLWLTSANDLCSNIRIVFVEAETGVIMRRYAATRRPHPLEAEGFGLEKAVDEERRRLERLRNMADMVVDTSRFSIHDLRRYLQKHFSSILEQPALFRVHLMSFGFKYGIPSEADMMYDLRFLPNPYFDSALKEKSGLDKDVSQYVLAREPGISFLRKLEDFLLYLLPLYRDEGRYKLAIAFGCTGGRHRSVAVTEAVAFFLREHGYTVTHEHRHLELG